MYKQNTTTMKTSTLILFLLITFNLQSQVWIDHGATWHYNYSEIGGGGFIKITYTEDTLISGQQCQKLISVKYRFSLDQYSNIVFLGTINLPTEYTFASGDTVFYYKNNQFYTLYNFGAQPGDSWNLGIDTNQFQCSQSYAHVDSIGTINLNGHSFRWLSLSNTNNSSVGLFGKIVERFGAYQSYLFPVENNCDSTIVVEFDWISFSCFEDTTFSLYNISANDCEYLLSINSNIQESNPLIYPNPTSGIIKVNCNNINSIEVYNSLGNKVVENKSHNTIDLSFQTNGIYLIKVLTDSGVINKIIIKNKVQ
jgi:hypothetical protein